MKILLAHVYCLDEDRTEMEVMRPYPPLGILYVSGYLQLKGIEHAVFDGTFLTPHAIYDMLLATNPDVVAFYANFLTRERIVKILDEIRINPAFQNIKTVIGGPDVRYHQKEYMNSGADFLVIGEGEQTFHELIVALKEKKNVENIPGLSLKNANGEIVQTGERKHFSKPDELPWPNREKIDLQKYLIAWKNKHGYNSITVNTQRGCPYSCRWCSHAVFGDTYRRRSPANVIDEIEYLQKRYNPDSYWFVDDVFTMSEKWIN
ncbi:MAG: cobalamin-dependent protein, partial [Bacteroidales bacterium]|nr:cobalamin-dependent protein [Bacteroidales bacterium]